MDHRLSRALAVVCAVAFIAACHLDSDPVAPPTTPPPTTTPPPPDKFEVTGTVTGMTGTGLVLESGETTITIDENGEFTLFSDLEDDTDYDVSVAAHPATPHNYCTVANGTGTASDDVSDIAVTCGPAVKVAAQVTDEPIAFASVSVKVGDTFYTTTADANGMFSLNIPITTETGLQMVTTEATGTGDQAHVTFAGILGTLNAIVEQAGDAGELTDSANITNVSTARFALVLQAYDGEVPTTGDALQTAERSVNATDVMNLAAAIKLIVDSPETYSLPTGTTSILAFAKDPAAVATFIAATPAEDLEQALTEILADTSLVPGYKEADVPGVYFQIPAAKPGFLSPQGSGLIFNEDGTGEFLTSGSGGFPVTATMTWEVIDGIVKVTYDHPVTTPGTLYTEDTPATEAQIAALNCQGIFQVNADFTVTEREYSLLSSGSLVDQVRVTTLTEIEYGPVAVNTECDASGTVQIATAEPLVEESTTEIWKSDALPEQPFTTAEIAGNEWGIYMLVPVGPYYGDAEPTVQFANMLVEFNADGSAHADGGDDVGLDLEWEITEHGDLMLSYGDWTQELSKLQVSGDAVKSVMFFQNTVDEEARFAYFDLAVRKNDDLLADGAEALWLNEEGKFWNAYTNGWSPSSWDGDEAVFGAGAMTFGWSFRTGGEAWNHQFFYEPYDYANDFVNDGVERQSAWHREMVWEMDEASEEDGWIGFSGPYVNGCYNTFPTVTCYRRDWVPLGLNAAGYMYVNETVQYSPDNGATWALWIAPRITPVREVAFPEVEQFGESFINTGD